ncbi:hypothetical protein C8R44DRAFT_755177 [Mycena epipterygia]|nr:hypothetical protein C8R44DRAFT_755177 [Mycena epipterygia]
MATQPESKRGSSGAQRRRRGSRCWHGVGGERLDEVDRRIDAESRRPLKIVGSTLPETGTTGQRPTTSRRPCAIKAAGSRVWSPESGRRRWRGGDGEAMEWGHRVEADFSNRREDATQHAANGGGFHEHEGLVLKAVARVRHRKNSSPPNGARRPSVRP